MSLSALIESSEDPIWSVGLDFGILTINRAARQILEKGIGSQAPIGARPADLIEPAEAAIWNGFYERALADGSLRVEHTVPSGRTLEMTFNRIVSGDRILGISGFGKDISRRKSTERALRDAEKKYRDIFDGALEGMFQAYPDGRIRTANRSLANLLGYGSVEEMVSTVIESGRDQWLCPEERRRYLRHVEEHGSIQGFEGQLKRKDGSGIWVRLSARMVHGEDGKPGYLEGFIGDVTQKKQTEKLLLDSDERFRATFEQAAVGILHMSFEGRIMRCNKRFGEIVGRSPEEVMGMTIFQLTPPEDHALTAEMLEREVTGANDAVRFEKRYVRKDRSLTWVALTISIQRDGQGNAQHSIVLVEDINARKQAEEKLAAAQKALATSEERYRTTFQMSLDAVNINRLSDGKYLECNRAFLEITGYSRDEVIGHSSLELNIWADPVDRITLVDRLNRDSLYRNYEAQFRKKNGEILWGLMSATLIELDGVPCVLSVICDISDAKVAEREIRNLAFYDPLTHLPNRRMLLERLRQAIAAGKQSRRLQALLFVDLDDFKTLNDTLGHQTGDLLLKEVAARLSSCVRQTDAVARLGGDEFVVMLKDLSENPQEAATQAQMVGEKILNLLREPYRLAGRECLSTSSIGITVFGRKRESSSEILKQADIAMYQAKSAGRNTMHFFAPELQVAVTARATLESDLRQGIKSGQFVFWYQPLIYEGLPIGAEALVRWNHPLRRLLLPGEFIPLAEETGLIVPLGYCLLQAACQQIAAWASCKQTAHLSLAVNISALQFRQPDFVDHVLAALKDSGANPENLQLELTESTLVLNSDDVTAKMMQLKVAGVRFSLDDFGTGYSSLAYLKRLPLDQLKIDRAFVRDILEDATSRAIAQTIITLARAMDLSVIAEGVETEEQRILLNDLGCHTFQGYLFSSPLPLEEFERFCRDSLSAGMPFPLKKASQIRSDRIRTFESLAS